MPEIFFALLVGFILGVLVGYLLRNESRRYDIDLTGHHENEH